MRADALQMHISALLQLGHKTVRAVPESAPFVFAQPLAVGAGIGGIVGTGSVGCGEGGIVGSRVG